MKNFVQRGDTLPLIAPYPVKAGDVVIVGAFAGIAATDAALGEEVECDLVGVFHIAKKTGEAFGQGAPVYWDGTAKRITTTAEGNTRFGAAATATQAAATVARVRLDGAHV
jgi:predicted RecA/RadA family phage recombinase